MKLAVRFFFAAAVVLATGTAMAGKVPVEDFFKDPEFTSVTLSPTGEYITVAVPQGDRTLLAAFRVADMKLVGKWDYGRQNHAENVIWVNDKRFFVYVSKKLGRYDFRVGTRDLHASDVDGKRRTLIPNGGTYQIINTLRDDPDYILVQRSVDSAYLSKMNVNTGDVRTMATAPIRFGSFLVDHDQKLRYAVGMQENRESVTLRREGDRWVEVHSAGMGEAVHMPLRFDRENRLVYTDISEKGEPAKLYAVDTETGQRTLVSENANVESSRLLTSSDGKDVLGVIYLDGFQDIDFTNKTHPETMTYAGLVNAFPDHAISFDGISKEGRYVLFRAYSDVDPGSYYLFDRQTNQAKFLLSAMDWIKPDQMSPMRPFSFSARDGTELHGYVTVPLNSSGKNLPLILHPHGGPHGPRDVWGFNPEVQFLADRGYAVLQVNFRGSGGYGNAFENKGYRNWGTTMIDDMTDAVQWAVREGIADPNRVCVYGASYGGYAALQSVVREPDRYKCTIGYVGMYDMDLWLRDSDVAGRKSGRSYQNQVFPESRAERNAQSPVHNVDRIRVPVMLAHGERDERVPISQYRALKKALVAAGKPPEVEILAPKEAHGFQDLENNVRLYNAMEAFLGKHIGGQSATAGN